MLERGKRTGCCQQLAELLAIGIIVIINSVGMRRHGRARSPRSDCPTTFLYDKNSLRQNLPSTKPPSPCSVKDKLDEY